MPAPHLIYPCKTRNVTCGFYCYAGHNAVDLGAYFEPVWAAAAGRVKTADQNVVYGEREGKYIEIDHGGWITRYFHLSQIHVVVGQQVAQGQQIGVTGNSGYINSGGVITPYAPHLHFALWAPTRAEALTVWANPQQAYGYWAVDPVWVIEHQVEEEDDMKSFVADCGDGYRYVVRPDGTRILLGLRDQHNKVTQAGSVAAGAFLAARGMELVKMSPGDLYEIPSYEEMLRRETH